MSDRIRKTRAELVAELDSIDKRWQDMFIIREQQEREVQKYLRGRYDGLSDFLMKAIGSAMNPPPRFPGGAEKAES